MDTPSLAQGHLQKAIEWVPTNAQAYRMLGKAYRAQGDWPAAFDALARYAELQPQNPLGPFELAETYSVLKGHMASMHFADLITLLPQAETNAPSPIGGAGGQTEVGDRSGCVGADTISLPPDREERDALVMCAPSWVTYTLVLPAEPALLRFAMGTEPSVAPAPSGTSGDRVAASGQEGATLSVSIDGEPIFSEPLKQTADQPGWQERSLDLAPWAGQEVTLRLSVLPSSADGETASPQSMAQAPWVAWGSPQVVDGRLAELESVAAGTRIVDTWRRAGLRAEDLIVWGEQARAAQRYETAKSLYEQAARMEPLAAEPWYYLGLLFEDQGDWPAALHAHEKAVSAERFLQGGRGSVYYHMGEIYQRQLPVRQPEQAMESYRAALAAGDFRSPEDAAWTHARLAQLLYSLSGDPGKAELEFDKAKAVVPNDPWLYIVHGDMYRQEGEPDRAATLYRRALEIDPDFDPALTRLDQLAAQGD